MFRLFVPAQAVGANLVYFDLFNADKSCVDLRLVSVLPIVQGSAAVTGVVGVDLYLTRTTAVGTGGTAATNEGTSLSAATFSGMEQNDTVPGLVTARLTPTGGGTAGAVLSYRSVFTEETSSAPYTPACDFVRGWHLPDPGEGHITVRQNTGIRVVQGSVASVGNIAFDVFFKLIQK